jgi:two-component system cell cycle sensor histidine kinase/response regulator CckA
MTRILVVEDESVVAEDIEQTLLGLGYEVQATAATGLEAIANTQNQSPDLVLMDVRLRGEMNGIEAACRIRQQCDVPVVFLTAFADADTVARARKTEPFGYIVKPFNDKELRGAIEVALNRHDLERRIREREHWFSTTLKSVGDAIMATDPEGRVTFMNPVAESLTGWKELEALGKPASDVLLLVSGEDGKRIEDPFARARREGRTVLLDRGTLLLSRSGTRVAIDDSAAPIVDRSEQMLGAVIVFRDISERKKLEARLALSDRLAALGMPTAGIAHEINNPLAYNLANCGVALRELTTLRAELVRILDPGSEELTSLARRIEEATHALKDAQEGAERVQRIVSDLKMLSPRPDQTDYRVLALVPVLESATRMAWNEIKHRARFVYDFQAEPYVHGDQAQLAQVVVNLLINAAHAIPEGRSQDNQIRLALSTDAQGNAVIEVHDTGPGIPPEVMLHIFDPFFTTKPVGIGSGLGLSISDSLVEAHAGKLSAKSVLGAGSTFRVWLPKAETPATRPPTNSVPAPAAETRERARVLVVDDEPKVGHVVRRVLAPDHDVTVTVCGAEALGLLRRGMTFDVILCDLMMPEMSGIELHAELRRELPHEAERMVFLTGGAFTPQTRDFVDSLPPERLLAKPFPLESLQKLVTRCLKTKI